MLWGYGSRFVLANNDEGIYLASAMRILHGQLPYRDFFFYLGPGCPLIHAAALRLLGEKLWIARIPLSVDLGILTASLFWLTARLAGKPAAFLLAFCFLAFETAEYDRVVADHRWDSSAAATLAIVWTVSLLDSRSHLRALLAGACAALAVWITTPVAVLAMALFVAACVVPRLRPMAEWIAAGAAACSAVFLAWLSLHHILWDAFQAILWPAAHYVRANRTPYGWVIGGYENLFHGVVARETVVVAVFLIFLTLPATLPILAAIGWPVRLRLDPKDPRAIILLLLASMAALIVSTLPRPDLIHLMYISPVAYVLAAALAVRVLPKKALIGIGLACAIMAASDYAIAIERHIGESMLQTRAGLVRGSEGDLAVLQMVTARVKPGQTLFAFPYWPNFYFPTGARNPTRYAYLQPGMFSAEEEREALGELEQSPPDWILYVDTPASSYLRIWPASDPARLRFASLEEFIVTRYHSVRKLGTFDLRAQN